MKVQFRCFASLPEKYECDYTDGAEHEIRPGERVEDFASRLEISEKDVKIIFVNGKRATKDTILNDGDRLAFAPSVAGM
jgi:molybdopterin converting factor small subunit